LLQVESLTAGYGRTLVLRDVTLGVDPGEMVALLGPNGAGKSTLMKTIVGLLRPHSGSVSVGGRRVDALRPDVIARAGVALVPEGRRIFAYLTVRENLLLAASARRDGKGVDDDLEFLYEVFPVLKERSGSMGNQLSGGQQQMVALGRAVMQQPRLVLMDEPSIGLSPLMVQQLPRMIQGVQERTGAAVLIVEQDAGLALGLASRGYIMRGGRIVREGATDDLRHSSVLLETYLGSAEPPAASVGSRSTLLEEEHR
jgi:branched-chain amino acid transport system ATP-binding protein